MKHAVLECFAIRNAIQWVHELGVLYQRSGKFKVSFLDLHCPPENY